MASLSVAKRAKRLSISLTLSYCSLLAAIQGHHPRGGTGGGVAQGGIANPDFWDVDQAEMDELLRQSAPDLRSASAMGGLARQCNELPGYVDEEVVRLTNATVMAYDGDLLCADFPRTCSMDPTEVEGFLLELAAWFGKPHVDSGLHDIPHDASRVLGARRACQAGRALLVPTIRGGGGADTDGTPDWVDVKGSGGRDPMHHSIKRGVRNVNGVTELQNALWEYTNEKTVAAALSHHSKNTENPDHHFATVGYYAVLSLGFEIPWETDVAGTWVSYPAGALVRQASRRHPNPYGFMAPTEGALFEQILNTYGMRRDSPVNDERFASVGLPNPHCRRVNVQGTVRPREVVDFGELYADPVWPPPEGECLVHWGKTATILDTPLWNDPDVGSNQRVRDFLAEELRELPPIRNETWPAKEMNSVRQRRMWLASDGWWNGRKTVADVRDAISAGLIVESMNEDAVITREEL